MLNFKAKKNDKFIWGVKINNNDSIQLVYNTKKKKYRLDVNSIQTFESHQDEAKYFLKLLDYFTKFMKENNYDMNDPYYYFAWAPTITNESSEISELYTMFKVFVKGYEAVYGE